MKNKIVILIFFFALTSFELLSQAARNIPRDTGPVQWTFGNILVFIVFPVLLIIFLFFYVKKLTRQKIEEKEQREEEEQKKSEN